MHKMTFDDWFAAVTRIMYKTCGMGPDDLPDYCYHDAWDAGDTPDDAAQDAIEKARTY